MGQTVHGKLDRGMKTADFLDKVALYFSHNRLDPESGIIVAYSGGADSGSLLKALSELGIKKIRAVHITHNLRSGYEGQKECELVKAVCCSQKVPLTIATIRQGAIERYAKNKKLGIEAAARAYRYHILQVCAKRGGYSIIATAHTKDDQLETVLARLLYSTGPEGLQGIPAIRQLKSGVTLCRPLLFAFRSDVEEYALAGALPWVSDPSNRDNSFQRNRIRNLLVPLLDREFSGWRTGLAGTSRKMTETGAAVSAVVLRVLKTSGFEPSTRTYTFSRSAFENLETPFKQRILLHAIYRVTGRLRLSGKAITDAIIALNKGVRALQVLHTSLVVGQELITISPLLDFQAERGYFFMIASEMFQKVGEMEIVVDWDASDGKRMNLLLEGAFTFPFVVRSRKPGDSIVISGKSVRIDDLIKAWRLGDKARRLVPVLEDAKGIVAVMPDALEGIPCLGKARFRDYEGQRNGRMMRINIKGA